MDLESLRLGLPEARIEILTHEEFLRIGEVITTKDDELTGRLNKVIDVFNLISLDFRTDHATVYIERVPTVYKEKLIIEQGGKLGVRLDRVPNSSIAPNKSSDEEKIQTAGFRLVYFFEPFKADIVGETDPSKRVTLRTESTIWETTYDTYFAVGANERAGIQKFAGHYSRSIEQQEDYANNYLPNREAQISDVESSIPMILSAIANMELNAELWNEREKIIQKEDLAKKTKK